MPDSVATLSRRSLLAAAPLPLLPALAAPAAHADPGGQVIAYVTDVHVNPESSPHKTARARATAAALVELDPDLVIHGGDLTEHGSAAEFEAWRAMFPRDFFDRIHHVPGNHESAWINDNYEAYQRHIGPLHHSTDVGDVHVVFTNATTHGQSLADYQDDQIAWLRDDLAKAAGRPILVVGHHVLALTPNQVRNADKVLEVLTEGEAHAFLCGHIHSERDNVVNGMTELTGLSTGETAGYYQLTRRTTDASDVFEVDWVGIPDLDNPTTGLTRRRIPPIDLAPKDRNRLRPLQASATINGDKLDVHVRLRPGVEVTTVQAAIMGPELARGTVTDYQTLSADGSTWSASLDLDDVPPGENRAFIRVTGTPVANNVGGDLWHTTLHFETAGFHPVWATKLQGTVTAALTSVGDHFISATTTGQVRAWRHGARRPHRIWANRIGGIHSDPVLVRGQDMIVLPSEDHHVYALDTRTGRTKWRADLGAPVMTDLAATEVDGDQVIFAIAVTSLFCLNSSDGSVRWSRKLTGISGGPVVCDGERIYLGVGDGCTWALDARTGDPIWSIDQSGGKTDSYRTIIYGPWQAKRLLVPGGSLAACSHASMLVVSRDTGEIVWERPGSYAYSPAPRMWGDDILVVTSVGTVVLLDPDTGEERLEVETVPYQKNADFLLRDSTVIVTGAGGLVAAADLDDGTSRVLGQMAPDYVFSTPVLSPDGNQYIVATMAGDLRSYQLP